MNQTTTTKITQTSAPATTKTRPDQASTKDAGRVHIGAGAMRF